MVTLSLTLDTLSLMLLQSSVLGYGKGGFTSEGFIADQNNDWMMLGDAGFYLQIGRHLRQERNCDVSLRDNSMTWHHSRRIPHHADRMQVHMMTSGNIVVIAAMVDLCLSTACCLPTLEV